MFGKHVVEIQVVLSQGVLEKLTILSYSSGRELCFLRCSPLVVTTSYHIAPLGGYTLAAGRPRTTLDCGNLENLLLQETFLKSHNTSGIIRIVLEESMGYMSKIYNQWRITKISQHVTWADIRFLIGYICQEKSSPKTALLGIKQWLSWEPFEGTGIGALPSLIRSSYLYLGTIFGPKSNASLSVH